MLSTIADHAALSERVRSRRVNRSLRRGIWSTAALSAVESLMVRLLVGERLEKLGAIGQEHLATGGRRFRARLALSTVEALGGARERAVAWAAACELLHNATLIHDDLQDGDEIRRGHPAVWARHGFVQAINAGDLLLMLPYRAVDSAPVSGDVKWILAHALARHAEAVVRGQSAEQELVTGPHLAWEDYLQASMGKTSALFSLPVFGAAILAGCPQAEAEELAGAFGTLGVVFQMQDDILDLYGDKGRGEQGSDLKEGKVSALVVEHLRLHPRDRAWLLDLLTTPREYTTSQQVAEARRRFLEQGALDGVWARILALEAQATQSPALQSHPEVAAVAHDLVAEALRPVIHTSPAHERGEYV